MPELLESDAELLSQVMQQLFEHAPMSFTVSEFVTKADQSLWASTTLILKSGRIVLMRPRNDEKSFVQDHAMNVSMLSGGNYS